ncbi:MAG: hypothetical protein MRY74_17480 [Neomegalonema sp.]|nr:hypothetical protein [Neomegalonema sp.]
MKLLKLAAAAVAVLALSAAAATAQTPKPAAPKKPTVGSTIIPYDDPTQFFKVDSGLFQIETGQVVDLGDRYLTLAFYVRDARKKWIDVYLGGTKVSHDEGYSYWWLGTRRSLHKKDELYKDKRFCVLDFVNFVSVRGGNPSAVFRFRCE